jgi:hypothetical protein
MSNHGTRASYQAGCRCLLCSAANARYEADRSALRARGIAAVVSTIPARQHLLQLQQQHVGLDQASSLSGLSLRLLQRVRSGQQRAIRIETSRRILAIPHTPAPGTLVTAWQVKRWVRVLLGEGFTRRTLAHRLGLKTPRLSLHTKHVTRRTEQQIARLYRRLTSEDISDDPPDLPIS